MAVDRLLAIAATLALVACSGSAPERLTLGTAHVPAFGLVFIADAKGYFAARGLAVEQRRFATGRDAVAALAAGEVDAATAFTPPVVVRAVRDDLEVVTTLHTSTRGTRLVARSDRGISRAEDVAGKRIGLTLGTAAEYFLDMLLAYSGVDGAARVVDVAPGAAVDALVRGELDAIVSWPPHIERARRTLGATGIVEIAFELHTDVSMLVVRDATHQARRAALVKLVQALADAERLVWERPEEAFRALRGEFPELSDAELRETWSDVAPALGVTHELAVRLEREAAWFRTRRRAPDDERGFPAVTDLERGRVGGPPLDVGRVLDPDVLTAVDPEAVTFVPPPGGKTAR